MAYYASLVAEWATITTANPTYTTAQKLAAINALTVPGPTIDVQASTVLGYMMLNMKLGVLQAYATTPPNGSSANIIALVRELLVTFTYPAFDTFETSNVVTYSAVNTMLEAMASDTNTGITSTDVSNIMGLAQTSLPWWAATVAQGGGGLTSPVGDPDLESAGNLS